MKFPLIAVFLAFFLFFGCASQSSSSNELGMKLASKQSSCVNAFESKQTYPAGEKFVINLECHYLKTANEWNFSKETFAPATYSCPGRYGEKPGENIKYVYFDNLYIEKHTKDLDAQGNIKSRNDTRAVVSLVLRPLERRTVPNPTATWQNLYYVDFEVVSADCNEITNTQ